MWQKSLRFPAIVEDVAVANVERWLAQLPTSTLFKRENASQSLQPHRRDMTATLASGVD